jgi:hypothetical protein
MECVIETKASTILQFIHGLRGDLHLTFEEGTWASWLYDLLKPQNASGQVKSCRLLRSPDGGSDVSQTADFFLTFAYAVSGQ